jgi:hypothetical protein
MRTIVRDHRSVCVAALVAVFLVPAVACDKTDKAAEAAKLADTSAAVGLLQKPLETIGMYRAILPKRPGETVVDPRIGALAADEIGRGCVVPESATDAGASQLSTRARDALGAVTKACKADPTSKDGAVNDATRTACAKAIDDLDAAIAKMATEQGDAGASLPRVPAADVAASAKTPYGRLAFGGEKLQAYRKAFADPAADLKQLELLGTQAGGEMTGIGKEISSSAAAGSQLKGVADVQPTAIQVVLLDTSALLDFYPVAQHCAAKPVDPSICAHSCAELKAAKPSAVPAAMSNISTLCK